MVSFPEGVHFLTAEQYVASTHFGLTRTGIFLLVLVLLTLIVIITIRCDLDVASFVCCIGLLICIIPGFIMASNIPEYNTQFLVQVDKYTSYSEIQKDFRIVSTKDNIIVLRPNIPIPWDEYTQKED